MAAKKAKKQVTLTIDSDTIEKLIDAHAALGDTQGLETFADDPDVAKRLTKRAKKR